MNLYLTADQIGAESGGGKVTREESEALKNMGGPVNVVGREQLKHGSGDEPWKWDETALSILQNSQFDLAHVYSGTFGKTVKHLKDSGCKVAYTIAAHDRFISREEHEKFGIPFADLYPHLCVPELWDRYIEGYRLADMIICPSKHSADAVAAYGGCNRIEIIPHGVDLPSPETIAPLPNKFVLGYLGAAGPDKGLIYLLQAWAKLNYKDALLIIAGKESLTEPVYRMVAQYGGGAVCLSGWVNHVRDFYNSISCYCQPSASEGMGIEVLEAMSYGRPIICSYGAGASDVVGTNCGFNVEARNVDGLAVCIDQFKNNPDWLEKDSKGVREAVKNYTWDKIKARYVEIWGRLMEK